MTLTEFAAKRIREIRNGMGISQDELAKSAQVSQARISDVELAKTSVSLELLESIAAGLAVPPEFIISGPDRDWGVWLAEVADLSETGQRDLRPVFDKLIEASAAPASDPPRSARVVPIRSKPLAVGLPHGSMEATLAAAWASGGAAAVIAVVLPHITTTGR